MNDAVIKSTHEASLLMCSMSHKTKLFWSDSAANPSCDLLLQGSVQKQHFHPQHLCQTIVTLLQIEIRVERNVQLWSNSKKQTTHAKNQFLKNWRVEVGGGAQMMHLNAKQSCQSIVILLHIEIRVELNVHFSSNSKN